jgi:RNA polymerase sigma factor (sigma-70 family)
MEPGHAIGQRIAQRDERALEEAYETYGPALLRYVARHVGRDEAEDVVQRTFLEAWNGATRYNPAHRFSSWLFTIAHRRAIDTLRTKRFPVIDVESVRELVGEDGRETMERYADAADVRVAVAELPDHEREVIQLAYFSGLSQPEIATQLGVPLGTVKARASRGTRRLGERMRGVKK